MEPNTATIDKDPNIPTGVDATSADVAALIADGTIPAAKVTGLLNALGTESTPSKDELDAAIVKVAGSDLTVKQVDTERTKLLGGYDETKLSAAAVTKEPAE